MGDESKTNIVSYSFRKFQLSRMADRRRSFRIVVFGVTDEAPINSGTDLHEINFEKDTFIDNSTVSFLTSKSHFFTHLFIRASSKLFSYS